MPSSPADVRLRPLEAGDAPRMVAWMADPAVREGLGFHREATLESTLRWLEGVESAFAIMRGEEHVGNVVLDQRDPWLGTARFSIYLGSARGRGLGRAASRLALGHGFEQLGLRKIWLIVHAENEPAIRLYRSLGFQQEGVLRQEFRLGERHLDALRFGLFPHELRPPGIGR